MLPGSEHPDGLAFALPSPRAGAVFNALFHLSFLCGRAHSPSAQDGQIKPTSRPPISCNFHQESSCGEVLQLNQSLKSPSLLARCKHMGELTMRLFFAGICVFILCSSADAQVVAQVRSQNISDSVFKSMQCEIGLFAARARSHGLDPSLRAHVKWSTTGTSDWNTTASATLGGWLAQFIQLPHLGGGYNFTQVDARTIEGKLNINQGNTAVCVGRRPAIPLGIYDCLIDAVPVIKGGLTQTCSRKITAKASFDASGKFSFWIISLGPSFAWSDTVVYEMIVDAPAADAPPGRIAQR